MTTAVDIGPDLSRAHNARNDLDWLPPSFKAVRWAVAGSVWTALAGGVVGLAALTFGKGSFIFVGKGVGFLAVGGYYAGDRAARSVLRKRLGKLARGAGDLGSFAREADGELLHVRGRVKARRTVPALLSPGDERAVYRRVVVDVAGRRVIHEAACDFALVDDSGEEVLVAVARARLLCREPERVPAEGEPLDRLSELGLVTLPQIARRRPRILAGEALLRDGAEVEVVGYKTRVVDQTVASRLERDTPMRATLRGGRELPLLISPVRE